MIFAKANKKSCAIVKNIIHEYCKKSGQVVNFNKLANQCSNNVGRREREAFQSLLEIKPITTIDKYLGFPIINEKVTTKTFQHVVDKTENNLSKWKANSLSKAGRVTLIQSTLSSIPIYTTQSFMLSKKNLEELDKIY